MILHYIVCLCLLLLLAASHTHILALCKTLSALGVAHTLPEFHIFTEVMAIKDTKISHLTIYDIQHPPKAKGSCLIIPFLKSQEIWPLRLWGCFKFNRKLAMGSSTAQFKKSNSNQLRAQGILLQTQPWLLQKGQRKELVVPAPVGRRPRILCRVLHVVLEGASENAHFWKRWKRSNSSAEICCKFCAWWSPRELSALDPRCYVHNSSSTEYTQTLSRDIKESCLTLKIKLISCQDFTRACVTANDMLKPCKKKINMSDAKPISFCASLNYAHLHWFDTQLAWQQSVCCHKLK